MDPDFRISKTIPPDGIARSADILWQAFGGKLGKLVGPDNRGVAFLERILDPSHGIAALDPEGQVQGVAGIKTKEGALIDGKMSDLHHEFGGWGACWRAPLLSILLRPTVEGQLLMDGLAVDVDRRGQGIGTALLSAVKSRAAALGQRSVRLDVVDTNPRARALYERQGFVPVRTRHLGPLRRVFGFRAATTMVFELPETDPHRQKNP